MNSAPDTVRVSVKKLARALAKTFCPKSELNPDYIETSIADVIRANAVKGKAAR